MATTTSYSSIYSKELKNIRAEQKLEQEGIERKAESQKMIGGGMMQAQAYLGKGAKKLAKTKLEETAIFNISGDMTDPITKFETIAGETPELFDKMGSFGDVGKTAWESFEKGTGMSFSGETTQLTPEYITAGLESGSGVSELGIGELTSESLFPDIVTPDVVTPGAPVPSAVGEIGHPSYGKGTLGGTQGVADKIAEWKSLNPDIVTKGTTTVAKPGDIAKILTEGGEQLGTATLGEGGKIATEFSKTGIEAAAKGSATASAASVAGSAAAGVGIATGGYQAIQGFSEGDVKSGIAGTAKVAGSALMFTPFAPIGVALTAAGTLLDFV